VKFKPWESTPGWLDPDDVEGILAKGPNVNNQYGATKLLNRMLAHGL
jgi:hypothetical protein